MGALEADVLGVLWESKQALAPGEVTTALDADLAYTTVMTILVRLWQKGLVTRARVGRAYVYSSTTTEAELIARRMHDALERASDQTKALSQFVDQLSPAEADQVRRLLSGR